MHQTFNKIIRNFLLGVLAFVPIAVILQIVFILKDIVSSVFHMILSFSDNYFYTGLVFLLSFAIFAYVGYRISIGKSYIIAGLETLIERIPLLNTVYRVTKKVVNMIAGQEKKEPREVVYIEYPKEGLWVPAYVTNKEKDKYILFVPTSPNPTSGFTIIVHESKVVKSEMNIEEATSFIISVGVDYDKAKETQKLS